MKKILLVVLMVSVVMTVSGCATLTKVDRGYLATLGMDKKISRLQMENRDYIDQKCRIAFRTGKDEEISEYLAFHFGGETRFSCRGKTGLIHDTRNGNNIKFFYYSRGPGYFNPRRLLGPGVDLSIFRTEIDYGDYLLIIEDDTLRKTIIYDKKNSFISFQATYLVGLRLHHIDEHAKIIDVNLPIMAEEAKAITKGSRGVRWGTMVADATINKAAAATLNAVYRELLAQGWKAIEDGKTVTPTLALFARDILLDSNFRRKVIEMSNDLLARNVIGNIEEQRPHGLDRMLSISRQRVGSMKWEDFFKTDGWFVWREYEQL